MRRLTISILALLTAFSAIASGALNGRVLCMAGSDHLAIEDPHRATSGGEPRQCGVDRCGQHAGAANASRAVGSGGADESNGGDRDPDGCVDVEASGTLAHEAAGPSFDNLHVPLPLSHLLATLASSASPNSSDCLLARLDANGGSPPSPTDLVGLRVIVLLT